MDPVTRRSFLIRGSAGAVGVAGIAAGGVALASASDAEPALSAEELGSVDGPVLVEVTDPAAGQAVILVGEREIEFTDRAFVSRVMRATR